MSRFMDSSGDWPVFMSEEDPSAEHSIYEGTAVGSGEEEPDPVHMALFTEYRVKLGDWKALALAQAARHMPELLGSAPLRKRRPGAPEKWDTLALCIIDGELGKVQQAFREGRIKRNLSTLTAACAYLTDDTPEGNALREQGWLPKGITMETLRNRMSKVRTAMKE